MRKPTAGSCSRWARGNSTRCSGSCAKHARPAPRSSAEWSGRPDTRCELSRELRRFLTDDVMRNKLRAIPSVERVLQALGPGDLPRAALVLVVRGELAELRRTGAVPDFEEVVARARAAVRTLRQGRLQPVINATGIVIHTNLGRAPLGPTVIEALSAIAANYNNLEYDLTEGERGGRAAYLERSLALVCGAEAATVANNCAAALVLVLRHFTSTRREVLISRGELVQIGGGFRIPEILE